MYSNTPQKIKKKIRKTTKEIKKYYLKKKRGGIIKPLKAFEKKPAQKLFTAQKKYKWVQKTCLNFPNRKFEENGRIPGLRLILKAAFSPWKINK